MTNRRALLIAAEDYGGGFARLPAVREDLRLLRSALEDCGFEVEVCDDAVVHNGIELDKAIRNFASTGDEDDIRLLYFTGHGLLVDDEDWIVPAGTSRVDATRSATQRVSTDLSPTLADAKTGLVVFVIDACRDPVPVTKGGSGWGDPSRLKRRADNFIRFFGCASTEVCQVLSGDPPISVFTRALVQSLAAGTSFSLGELLTQTANQCDQLIAGDLALKRQSPQLSYGELSAEKQTSLLTKPIFTRSAMRALQSVWPSFDPDRLNCLVVTSERAQKTDSERSLRDFVRAATQAKGGKRIWQAFAAACDGRTLLSGRKRTLSREFTKDAIAFASFSVNEALQSAETLDKAARALVEADLVVFDVTGFEPGIMFLIGIRSACCRSLTICSHGAGWVEGRPLEIPFNLQELSIGSHSSATAKAGSDPVIERFILRVETGFLQLARHPRYLDLPSFDALRELGPKYEAASTIPVSERVLVLCSYALDVFSNWEMVASKIKEGLWEKAELSPEVERIIDYGSPQLIWQSLYEQIRRTAGCVVDWSQYRGSVFLELGVRLAASEWGAVHIADARWLRGGAEAENLRLTQIEQMERLFSPIAYQGKLDPTDAIGKAVDLLLQRNPDRDGEAPYNRIHRTLLPVIGEVQEAHMPLADELKHRADALHHPQQERTAAPQILFHGNRVVKRDSENAALELRVAAWLYLEHRFGKAKVKQEAHTAELYRSLGRSAADALYDLGDDESIELASHIETQLAELDRG